MAFENFADTAILTRPVAKRQSINLSVKPEVRQFIDDEKTVRRKYTFNSKSGHPVEVIFYSPEELPFNQELGGNKQVFILGQKPTWRDETDWKLLLEEYRNVSEHKTSPTTPIPFIRHEAIESNKAVFFVESSPLNLLDLAFSLGVEDVELRAARKSLAEGRTTALVNEIMDKVIAAKIYDSNGNRKQNKDYEGEALLVSSLLGDIEASSQLEHRSTYLKAFDTHQAEKRREKLRETERSPGIKLELKDLVAVHLTNYPPERNGDSLGIISTFDGSNHAKPRVTVHFALNAAVELPEVMENYASGGWKDTGVAIISPLAEIISRNGSPTLLNPVDTFFEVSPGERLRLPQSTILLRGRADQQDLIVREGNNFYFKTNLNQYDVSTMLSSVLQPDEVKELDSRIRNRIRDAIIISNGGLGNPEIYSLLDKVWAEKNLFEGLSTEDEDIIAILQKMGVKQAKLPNEYTGKIKSVLVDTLKMAGIRIVITDMGFEAERAGTYGWRTGSSMQADKDFERIGAEIGAPVGIHAADISNQIEDHFLLLFKKLSEGKISIADYRSDAWKFVQENFPKLSPKLRRMLYFMGAL